MSPKFFSVYSSFGGGWFVMFNDADGVARSVGDAFDTKFDADLERNRLNLESGVSYLSAIDGPNLDRADFEDWFGAPKRIPHGRRGRHVSLYSKSGSHC